MPTLIDGSGKGYQQKVDSLLRAHTNSLQHNYTEHYVSQGHSYNINTGTINLTSGSKSALLYLYNNEDENLVIPSFIYLLGSSTGGATAEDILVEVERNPTGGTLISDATTITPINRNFGSENTLSVNAYKGAEGKTVTGGTVAIGSIFPSSGRQVVAVEVHLPKGSSVAVTVTPFSSNTSMDVQLATAVYLDKDLLT